MISLRAFACAAFAVLTSAAATNTHVVLTQRTAPADSYFRAAFVVPHGCDGAATTAVTVWLPETVLIAKPQPKPGWQVRIERVTLERPVPGPHGTQIKERVAKITWSGGSLPDDHFDEFAVQVRLPAESGTLYFPVEQICGDRRRRWSELPAPHQKPSELESPAASLAVTPKR